MNQRHGRIYSILFNTDYNWNNEDFKRKLLEPLIILLLAIRTALTVAAFILSWHLKAVSGIIIGFLFLISYFLLKKNRVDLSAVFVLFTLYGGILFNILFGKGIYDVSVFLLPAVILLSSILLKRKIYIWLMIVSILMFTAVSLISFFLYGKIPVPNDTPGYITATLLLVFLTIFIVNLFTNIMFRSFEAAKESEEKFRVITEKLKVGIYAYSSEGRFVYINEYMSRLLGYPREEILAMGYMDFVHPEDKKIVSERARKRLSGEEVLNGYELRIIRKDGETRWIYLSANKVDIQNKSMGVGAIFDIQEKKDLEHQILQEKEQLSVTLRSLNDGVIVINREGYVTLINRAAKEILEIGEREPLDMHINSLIPFIEFPDGHEDNLSSFIKKSIKAENGNELFEGKIRRRSGGDRILLFSISVLKDDEDTESGDVVVIKDITVEKERAENSERIEKLEALGLLAGGIAHDFNNILTGITGNIDLIKLYLKDSSDLRIKKRLDDARTAAERAGGLTKQLLTFSKGGAPVKKLISLPQLVKETVSFVLSGSSVKYTVSYPDDLWMINVDYNQISQVIQNLAMNSKQAIEKDGGAIDITLSNFVIDENNQYAGMGLKGGEYIEIVFRDNGRGIDSTAITKIFDPYFTTKSEGHGLGLATVFSIIRQHEGHITVRSEPEEGTAFIIYLPATPERSEINIGKPVNGRSRERIDGSERNVLIMDDEEIVVSVLSEMLFELSYSVFTVEDGESAVQLYRSFFAEGRSFSAVFLDLTVPGGMGGKEAASRILEIDPNACIIATSGYSADTTVSRFSDLGFSGFLKKPFALKDVKECLRNLSC